MVRCDVREGVCERGWCARGVVIGGVVSKVW